MDGSGQHPAYIRLHRREFSDSDQLAAAFASWGMDLTQLKPESGTHWTASGRLGALGIWTTALTGGYRVRTGLPKGTFLLQLDLASNQSRRLGSVRLAGDDILVCPAGAELDAVLVGQHHGISFILPQALVVEALAQRVPDAPAQLMRPDSPYIMSHCTTRVAALRWLASQSLGFDERSPVSPSAADSIVDTVLGTLVLRWHRETEARFRAPRSQHAPIVRRVEEFMRSNLGGQLMLHDLCRVARASQRSVEYAFSSTYGVGPKQYLKLLRLNEVRRLLKSQPPGSMSIAAIANQKMTSKAAWRRVTGSLPGWLIL